MNGLVWWHTSVISATLEVEKGSNSKTSWAKSRDNISIKNQECGDVHLWSQVYLRLWVGGSWSQAGPGQKLETLSLVAKKKKKKKKASGGTAQVVACMPRSDPSTTEKRISKNSLNKIQQEVS
jgi:hypothetical protein